VQQSLTSGGDIFRRNGMGDHDMTSLAGKRILVAEDEGLVALLIEEVLNDLKCQVVGPVSRLAELEARVEAGQFDGALLDVNLRGEHIFGVLPKLQRLGVPLIITSGYDAKTLFPPEFRDLPRIAKPFDEAALRQLCLKLFAKP